MAMEVIEFSPQVFKPPSASIADPVMNEAAGSERP